jgi:hypothetical protein
MAVWHYFAPRAHKSISTYPLRPNGNLTIGEQGTKVIPPLIPTGICHRLLHWPQLVVDGNMKLVHLIMRCPEADVSLSDGELFAVKREPYAEHVANAPQRQHVGAHETIVNSKADTNIN